MPPSLLTDACQRLPPGLPAHDRDVFLLMKAHVSVPELCQVPLLIQPGHGVLQKIEDCLNALQNHPGLLLVELVYFGAGVRKFTTQSVKSEGVRDFEICFWEQNRFQYDLGFNGDWGWV